MFKQKNIHKFVLLGFVIIIVCLASKELKENLCISIIGDEFGYWAAAAFFLNKPWNSVVATNSYYGWGYGLLLTPIMALFSDNSSLMYQMALILNGVILCAILFVTYKCALLLSKDKNQLMCALLAGVITLYPSCISDVYNTMPELFLILLVWFSFYLCIQLSNNGRFQLLHTLLLLVLGVYMFGVHQRTIGFLVVVIVTIILNYTLRKVVSYRNIIFLIGVFVGCLILNVTIKNSYVEWLYEAKSETTLINNDFQAVASSVSNLLSIEAIGQVIISIIGKMYYFNSGTFLFGMIGVASCIKNIYGKKFNEINIVDIFLVLSVIQAILIAALFMPSGFQTRTDILIYGRYIEYCILPLMLAGFISLIEKKWSKKAIILFILLHQLITIFASKYIATDSINTHMGNIFAIADAFCIKNIENKYAVLFVGKRAILVFLLVVTMIYTNKKYLQYISIVIIVCFNIHTFTTVYEGNIILWQQKVNDNVNVVENFKQKRIGENSLYIYDGGVGAKMVQFLLPNEECVRVEKLEDVETEAMVLTRYTKDYEEKISSQHEIIYKNSIVILWKE